jgi:hypothetical protein
LSYSSLTFSSTIALWFELLLFFLGGAFVAFLRRVNRNGGDFGGGKLVVDAVAAAVVPQTAEDDILEKVVPLIGFTVLVVVAEVLGVDEGIDSLRFRQVILLLSFRVAFAVADVLIGASGTLRLFCGSWLRC